MIYYYNAIICVLTIRDRFKFINKTSNIEHELFSLLR
jgi:hypothetical protein